jgi:hypothetical protein
MADQWWWCDESSSSGERAARLQIKKSDTEDTDSTNDEQDKRYNYTVLWLQCMVELSHSP